MEVKDLNLEIEKILDEDAATLMAKIDDAEKDLDELVHQLSSDITEDAKSRNKSLEQ